LAADCPIFNVITGVRSLSEIF